MKVLVTAAILVVSQLLISLSPALPQQRLGSRFAATETSAYNACLFAAWIDDYCRGNSWRPTASEDRVYRACIFANGGGRFPLAGRTTNNTDDYCRLAAHAAQR
jgi:hypothetical protein